MYSEEYTAEDEPQLQSEWKADPLGTHMLNHGKNSVILRLWKLTQHLWPGIYPETIISEVNLLEFENVRVRTKVKNGEGKDVLHSYWSKNFRIALEMLLIHPFWESQLSIMIICIQYAVMCRTDDQRHLTWPRNILTDSILWQTLDKLLQNEIMAIKPLSSFTKKPLTGLKVGHRNSELLKGVNVERPLHDFVSMPFETTKPFQPSQPDTAFEVRSSGFEVIIKALDAMTANDHLANLAPLTANLDEAPSHGYTLASDKGQSPVVRHYSLSFLENTTKHVWNKYPEEHQAALCQCALELASSLEQHRERVLLGKRRPPPT
ncbi:hypothetical protein PFICI_00920 [Pestalotiopsis fici W106-1]|uniref:Uncharacterized protein n=1 Tax=Pestalotiopsis fici (strain W106-1 / CGMCC3.15140) TaxID=1229662 RepID=W3XNK2_PESFW|nr:uncharacterized protein PFICI_00920 [Pestalotiopsis fici W106-1]ETS87092.1 hypothetical protein PFICI_00920 [Pestalotiopsis fici W106-1]